MGSSSVLSSVTNITTARAESNKNSIEQRELTQIFRMEYLQDGEENTSKGSCPGALFWF